MHVPVADPSDSLQQVSQVSKWLPAFHQGLKIVNDRFESANARMPTLDKSAASTYTFFDKVSNSY